MVAYYNKYSSQDRSDIRMKQPTGFLGTYFDLDAVLRLERWARIIAWVTLIAYTFDAGYTIYQNAYSAVVGGYPLDYFFLFQTLSRIAQGGVVFIILHAAAKIMLILLDIEDNTRRASRTDGKER
jgi:hypothetical protein